MGSQAAFYFIIFFNCTATFRPFYIALVDEKVLICLQ